MKHEEQEQESIQDQFFISDLQVHTHNIFMLEVEDRSATRLFQVTVFLNKNGSVSLRAEKKS